MAKEAAGVNGQDAPFGGVNVIIIGDFYQFPPVAAKASAPLYFPINRRADTEEDVIGRALYEKFKTVRVTDPVWVEILQGARKGLCSPAQLRTLRTLVLTSPECEATDFGTAPWKDAILVTPRHGVRTQWNAEALRKHCAETKNTLYICPVEDTINGRAEDQFSLDKRYEIVTKHSRGWKGRREKKGLPEEVELDIGMEAMVTYNVETDLDVANGARGTIVDIVLREDEPSIEPGAAEVRLRHVPTYLLVKMKKTRAEGEPLVGLERGGIVIGADGENIYDRFRGAEDDQDGALG
ncbi:hypothetical protein FRC04_000577 [Tulasnella sp. 424]|nr:hypothetical protein FRC04_000577 [Tulasnella sp. 424]